jgi:hypothetical protein
MLTNEELDGFVLSDEFSLDDGDLILMVRNYVLNSSPMAKCMKRIFMDSNVQHKNRKDREIAEISNSYDVWNSFRLQDRNKRTEYTSHCRWSK